MDDKNIEHFDEEIERDSDGIPIDPTDEFEEYLADIMSRDD